MNVRFLFCPACGAECNQGGSPFATAWAVATHVAGCINFGGRDSRRLHKSWAMHHKR